MKQIPYGMTDFETIRTEEQLNSFVKDHPMQTKANANGWTLHRIVCVVRGWTLERLEEL